LLDGSLHAAASQADVVLLPASQHPAQRIHVPVCGNARPRPRAHRHPTTDPFTPHRTRHHSARRHVLRSRERSGLARRDPRRARAVRIAALPQEAQLMARPASDIAPRIIAAARARFLAEGVDGASLRAIASDAGTNIGMVYYYFPTKDDLFFAVIEEVYAALLEDLTRVTTTQGSFEDRVRALYSRIGALKPNEKPILRLVALEAISGSPRFLRLLERFKRGHIALMFRLVADGVQSGAF